MGGSRDRSSGRKDNKKKRRRSRSYSSSKSYEEQQNQFQKNPKKKIQQNNLNNNNSNNMGQGSNNMNNNYMNNLQNNSMNNSNNYDDGNGGNQNNQNQSMNQQGHQQGLRQTGMNNFGNQRMMNNGMMMSNMMNQMQFIKPQPPTHLNFMMPIMGSMNMQQMGHFKIPTMINRFPIAQPMRQLPSFIQKQNLINNNNNVGLQMDQDDSNKKMNKFNEKNQIKQKQIDTEPFVTFKNINLISGIVEIIQNTCFSMEKSKNELAFYVCKKAFLEILKKLKEQNQNRYHDCTEDLLKYLEKQFLEEQKQAIKEFNQQKNLKEKNYLFNNTKFNNGIDNLDYQILKLVHKSKKLKDVFDVIQTESANKVDLSYQNESLARKLIIYTSNQYNEQSYKLYQESLKLFNQNISQ
ncbi:hypothetical protein ABPG72_022718 [Tetrahymena utriculariae]